MPKTRVQKEEAVVVIADKLNRAKSVVFADYQGLTMTQLSTLREQLKDQGAEFSVTKNSLLDLALQTTSYKLPTTDGPTATLFSYEDEVTPIKSLVKALKEAARGSVKAGIVGGQVYDAVSVTRLANLPSKIELQTLVVRSLSSPLYGIVGVLNANIRNLVYAVDQIRIKKGGEAQA